MPRTTKPTPARKDESAEPRKRSRTGCWPCKARKVKCGEEKPSCANCIKSGESCDYSIRLNWGGRAQKTRHSFSSATPSNGPSREAFIIAQNAFSPAVAKNKSPASTASPALDSSSPYSQAHTSPAAPRPGSSHTGVLTKMHHRHSTGSTALPAGIFGMSSGAAGSQHETRLPHIHQLDTEPYAQVFSPVSASSELPGSPDLHAALRLPPLSPPILSNSDMYMQPPSKKPRLSTPSVTSSPFEYGSALTPHNAQRLSVDSLLSGPPGDDRLSESVARALSSRLSEEGTRTYGYDYGFPDLDIPHNNDLLVISYKTNAQIRFSRSGTATPIGPGGQMAFESGGYYAKPVQIKISSRFEPLPQSLLRNPMDLLYFHHFLNHTARVLVPYDCEDNPLRSVMPEMAVRDPNLLNLLLAYSASHRAQLLHHKEPANRIALWMRDAFPSLRQALSSSSPISDASLATAVLLCSLKIVSPGTFDVPLTWQDYLATARQIIISRGGLEGLARDGDKYVEFCVKWYCYLETCGSLSVTNEEPLSGEHYAYGDETDDKNYYIDCFLGFTNRCMGLLAKVAKLARQCDAERIDSDRNIRTDWRPGDARVGMAHQLRHELERSRDRVNRYCVHIRPEHQTDEMADLRTSNTMYHWAGLIHLYRRVLGKPGDDPDVQFCVNSIMSEWSRIRKDSTYESCLLLPLFTAGCEVLDRGRREAIIERLKAVEAWGLPHFLRARKLMQNSWATGKPWETLVDGEFLG